MAKKTKDKITVDKETRDYMVSEIKSYFINERDEEIGDLAASFILDFILEKIAPDFYNRGLEDAYKYYEDTLSDVFALKK